MQDLAWEEPTELNLLTVSEVGMWDGRKIKSFLVSQSETAWNKDSSIGIYKWDSDAFSFKCTESEDAIRY